VPAREFGTTTGRPRRCGWFDAPVTAHACRINGVDGIGLMKIDVLDGFPEVGMVIGYRDGEGGLTTKIPTCIADWEQLKVEIKYFKGWTEPTQGIKDPTRLPKEARIYLEALSEAIETPIAYLSTGPDREEGFVNAGTFLEGMIQ
jgi:adenylosuccinate synthase